MLGLLVYVLPLYGGTPGMSVALDRTPGIVFARQRHAPLDLVADDRPVPRPSVPALPPACIPAVLAPDPSTCSTGGDVPSALVSRRPSPGVPRSPPGH